MTVRRSYDVLCHVIPCYPYIWYHLVLTGRIGMDRMSRSPDGLGAGPGVTTCWSTGHPDPPGHEHKGMGYWAFALGGPQSCKCHQ